jgi:hypothetical protein
MPTQQGDLSLLDDPVAQQLLQSTIPARLAYNWVDGTPRLTPINFHWNGKEIVMGTPPDAPKMKALRDGTNVALSIDSDTFPYKVLLVRGVVRTDVVEGVAPEYESMIQRVLGDEGGEQWLNYMRPITPRMVRIFVEPRWVGILDFETRFPSAIEHAMEQAQAPGS